MNLLGLRRDAVCPPHLAEAFEAHLNEKRFQEAFDLAKNDESMLGQCWPPECRNLQQVTIGRSTQWGRSAKTKPEARAPG